jgi:hypothetical protein
MTKIIKQTRLQIKKNFQYFLTDTRLYKTSFFRRKNLKYISKHYRIFFFNYIRNKRNLIYFRGLRHIDDLRKNTLVTFMRTSQKFDRRILRQYLRLIRKIKFFIGNLHYNLPKSINFFFYLTSFNRNVLTFIYSYYLKRYFRLKDFKARNRFIRILSLSRKKSRIFRKVGLIKFKIKLKKKRKLLFMGSLVYFSYYLNRLKNLFVSSYCVNNFSKHYFINVLVNSKV